MDDIVTELTTISKLVVDSSKQSLDSICEKLSISSTDIKVFVYLEFIVVYLYFLDREMFRKYGAVKRDVYMDKIYSIINHNILKIADQGKDIFSKMYWTRMHEYPNYKLDEEIGTKGGLGWEFGKIISNIIYKRNDYHGIMIACICIPLGMKYINDLLRLNQIKLIEQI